MVLRSVRTWLFFQNDGKTEDVNEALMRAVKCDRMDGEESFSIAVDM